MIRQSIILYCSIHAKDRSYLTLMMLDAHFMCFFQECILHFLCIIILMFV